MLHHCCRLRIVEASIGSSSVRVEPEDRVSRYKPRGALDPLVNALRVKGDIHLVLSCSSACLAAVYGEAGEKIREKTGSVILIEYERRGGVERLRVEGVEAELQGHSGLLEVKASLDIRREDIEPCVPGGAADLLVEKLRDSARRGLQLTAGSVLEYGGLVASLLRNPVAKSIAALGSGEAPCLEAIVSRKLWDSIAPILLAAMVLHDYLSRSIIAYPLLPYALLDTSRARLSDYGEGLGGVVARRAEEVALLASMLLGEEVTIEKVEYDGVSVPIVRVEGVQVSNPLYAPRVALALSIAAAIVEKRSMIIALGASAIEEFNRRKLLESLERVNALLLYTP